jgi:hypothetical protein
VEVGLDGDWSEADLDPPTGRFAWQRWTFSWDAPPGEHLLSCRATDDSGNVQPVDPPWNFQGMGNNLVQTIPVTAR